MKKFFSWFAIILIAIMVFTTVSPAFATGGGSGCPLTGNGWVKVDNLSGTTYTYTAPSGYLVDKWCYKAATTIKNGDVNPPASQVTIHSTVTNQHGNVQDLSDASFHLVLAPTATNSPIPVTVTPTRTNTPLPTGTYTAVPTATGTFTLVPTTTNTPEPTATEGSTKAVYHHCDQGFPGNGGCVSQEFDVDHAPTGWLPGPCPEVPACEATATSTIEASLTPVDTDTPLPTGTLIITVTPQGTATAYPTNTAVVLDPEGHNGCWYINSSNKHELTRFAYKNDDPTTGEFKPFIKNWLAWGKENGQLWQDNFGYHSNSCNLVPSTGADKFNPIPLIVLLVLGAGLFVAFRVKSAKA